MNLNIENPCSENWNHMIPNNKGRHCSSCQKTVVDIRSKNNFEVQQLVNDNSSNCIIANKYQLYNYQYVKPIKRLAFALLIVFGNALFSISATAQEVTQKLKESYLQKNNIKDSITISGVITDEYGDPVPFANVTLYKDDTVILGSTSDFDGKYTLKLKEENVNQKYDLVVSYIGYKEIRVKELIVNSNSVTKDFQFKEDDTQLMLGMMIMERPSLPKDPVDVSKTIIKRKEIEHSPNR